LGALQNLNELNCSSNQLQALPESLVGLLSLKTLDARKNPLTHIPQALRQKEGLELLLD
jgi:Leucine-rich repeat (LRR) protein